MDFLKGAFDRMTKDMASGQVPRKPASGEELPRIDDVSYQTNDEQKLVSFVRSRAEESQGASNRVSHEAQWLTNTAYFLGYDSIQFDARSRQFRPIDRSYSKKIYKNIHANMILPTVQNRLARLAKNPPKYDVRPNSNDESDKKAARVGMKILNQTWERERVNAKRLELLMLAQQCGHAWVHVSWDPTKGEELSFDDKSEEELQEMIYQGEITVDIVSPFEVFPDPLAKDEFELRYLTRAKVRPLNYFRDRFPKRGHLVKEEDAWLHSISFLNRINSMNSFSGASSGGSEQMKNAAIELTYYEAPSGKYPKGRMVTTANGVLLEDKPLPCGKINYVKFDDILVGGKFYSEAIITHLRPIQDQYNRGLRRRAEWTNKLLAGKYIAARGAGLEDSALNDTTEVVEYNPVPNARNSGAPEALQIPNIPQWAFNEDERLIQVFDNIAGINEVSKGQLPSAGIPAIGMQLLTEMDDTRIGVITENHEQAWARVGQLILKYAAEYYNTPRKLKENKSGGGYDVQTVQGSDLKDNFDVIVVKGSTLPGSKVLRRQEVINLFQMGLFGPPQDPTVLEKVLDMLEFGDVSKAWKDAALDEAQVNRHVELMKQGILPEIHELDNHPFILKKVNEFRKTEEFDELADQVKDVFHSYLEAHIQYMVDIQNPETVGTDEDIDIATEETQAQVNDEMAQQELEQAQQALAQAGEPADPLSTVIEGVEP